MGHNPVKIREYKVEIKLPSARKKDAVCTTFMQKAVDLLSAGRDIIVPLSPIPDSEDCGVMGKVSSPSCRSYSPKVFNDAMLVHFPEAEIRFSRG